MLRYFGIIFSVLVLVTPAQSTTQWYVDEEEEAHKFKDGTGTYENPVPITTIVVIGSPIRNGEPRVPARLWDIGGNKIWDDGLDLAILKEGAWQTLEYDELVLALPNDLRHGRWISKDTHYTVTASGGIGDISWESEALNNISGSLTLQGSGDTKTLRFSPPEAPKARTGKLEYRVTVTAFPELESMESLRQDHLSVLRQQYHDVEIRVPGRTTGWFSGGSIKIHAQLESNYNKLLAAYTKWAKDRNSSLTTVTLRKHSSTRTPRHNINLPESQGAAKESLHQYGCAYDLGPIKDLGGAAGYTDEQNKIISIWKNDLKLARPNGFTYVKGNTVHVQVFRYDEGSQSIKNQIPR